MRSSRQYTAPDQDKVQALQRHMERFGYRLVDTPIIDQADLFLTRAGDQLIEKLFTFERFGQQLALRPEFTASAAYHYARDASAADNPQPSRLQFYGPIFVDDPQNTRQNYQQKSMGAELIGMAGPVADVEIMAMAARGLHKIQVDNWQITIGHIGLMRRLLTKFELDSRAERFLLTHLHLLNQSDYGKAYVLQQFDSTLPHDNPAELSLQPELISENNTQYMLDLVLDASQGGMTMGGRDRFDIARRLLRKRKRVFDRQSVIDALDFLEQWGQINAPAATAFDQIQAYVTDGESQKLLDEWKLSIEWLRLYDVSLDRIIIQPALARGWDYYTGIVFELSTQSGENLGGGGRYDELVSLVGNGNSVPAVGFAYYLEALLKQIPPREILILTLAFAPADSQEALQWAKAIRDKGLSVELISMDGTSAQQQCVLKDGNVLLDGNQYTLAQVDQLISYITG
ncbi:MAG: ATP phosphoribosyltransferase regulatory subunit [Anaerolineae bacterium]|nr:ATP phosphoribosyltransferase regulatory subunit [Anaerolineae bacterium]